MMENERKSPANIDSEDEKKMLPCRYFLNGFCRKGNRCRFYHPKSDDLPNTMEVALLPRYFSTPPVVSQRSTPSPPSGISTNLGRRGTRLESMLNANAAEFSNLLSSTSSDLSEYCEYAEYAEYSKYIQSSIQPRYEQESEEPQQNTMFNHIDWSQYLAPGHIPPPPVHIVEEDGSVGSSLFKSSINKSANVLGLKNGSKNPTNMDNEDTPLEGRKPLEAKETGPIENRKLSAKLELRMKTKQIAKELADEPRQSRTYNLNALPLESLIDKNSESSENAGENNPFLAQL